MVVNITNIITVQDTVVSWIRIYYYTMYICYTIYVNNKKYYYNILNNSTMI